MDDDRQKMNHVTDQVVAGLSRNPVLLLLAVGQLAIVIAGGYFLTEQNKSRQELLRVVMERCLPAERSQL